MRKGAGGMYYHSRRSSHSADRASAAGTSERDSDRADLDALSLSTDIAPTMYAALGYEPRAANSLMGESLIRSTPTSARGGGAEITWSKPQQCGLRRRPSQWPTCLTSSTRCRVGIRLRS